MKHQSNQMKHPGCAALRWHASRAVVLPSTGRSDLACPCRDRLAVFPGFSSVEGSAAGSHTQNPAGRFPWSSVEDWKVISLNGLSRSQVPKGPCLFFFFFFEKCDNYSSPKTSGHPVWRTCLRDHLKLDRSSFKKKKKARHFETILIDLGNQSKTKPFPVALPT